MKYKVILDSCGSINLGENPYKQVDGAYREMSYCKTIEDCQSAVNEYISKHNLRASQWDGGEVFTIKNEYLGYISYNGRFWEGKSK